MESYFHTLVFPCCVIFVWSSREKSMEESQGRVLRARDHSGTPHLPPNSTVRTCRLTVRTGRRGERGRAQVLKNSLPQYVRKSRLLLASNFCKVYLSSPFSDLLCTFSPCYFDQTVYSILTDPNHFLSHKTL